ncbi:hypothetical protein ACUXZZ_45175 (plasmid) [Streptomyces graminifolii]|uniref:hypothetical protein n=1 Tax=Streptomyces graminifolii TaxID=1266771 RepID=UPI0040586B86
MTTSSPANPTAATGPHVVGLDLSLTATGIASTDGWTDVIGFKGRTSKETITNLPFPRRSRELQNLCALIVLQVGAPDLVVIERPAVSRAGGGAHERAWLWWETYRLLLAQDIPVGFLTTNQLKLYATGKGSGTKGPVIDAVARRWPDWATNGDDNRADAVVLMAAGRDRLGHPLATVPKAHRAAIDKADWPAAASPS